MFHLYYMGNRDDHVLIDNRLVVRSANRACQANKPVEHSREIKHASIFNAHCSEMQHASTSKAHCRGIQNACNRLLTISISRNRIIKFFCSE